MDNITEMLRAWQHGDQEAATRLIPLVQQKLRELAAYHLRREGRAHSWQTSDLVQEAWLKLMDHSATWQDRDHFFGIAARQMRQLLVSYARARLADKRGGGALQLSLDDVCEVSDQTWELLIPLNDALIDLAVKDPERVKVVELRYFCGLTVEETARVLGLAPSTVVRQWRAARAWLRRELKSEATEDETSTTRASTLVAD
jgi:RNA polymerase sigma factor (TIGR02999 family)